MIKNDRSPADFYPVAVLTSRAVERRYNLLVLLWRLRVIDTAKFWAFWE